MDRERNFKVWDVESRDVFSDCKVVREYECFIVVIIDLVV